MAPLVAKAVAERTAAIAAEGRIFTSRVFGLVFRTIVITGVCVLKRCQSSVNVGCG